MPDTRAAGMEMCDRLIEAFTHLKEFVSYGLAVLADDGHIYFVPLCQHDEELA